MAPPEKSHSHLPAATRLPVIPPQPPDPDSTRVKAPRDPLTSHIEAVLSKFPLASNGHEPLPTGKEKRGGKLNSVK